MDRRLEQTFAFFVQNFEGKIKNPLIDWTVWDQWLESSDSDFWLSQTNVFQGWAELMIRRTVDPDVSHCRVASMCIETDNNTNNNNGNTWTRSINESMLIEIKRMDCYDIQEMKSALLRGIVFVDPYK